MVPTTESSKTYSVRPATPEDLDTLVQIESKVHLVPWNRAHFEAELEKPFSHLWVLTDDETDTEIAAYLTFWILGEEAEILNIVVNLDHRGLGFAKYLLQKALNESLRKGVRRIGLDVRLSNAPAIRLYERQKFAITRIQKGFYTHPYPEDAYRMVLELDGVLPAEF